MTTMTLRGIDDTVAEALKERARREGSSVNSLILKILKESLGIDKKKRTVLHHDLDHLAGTWSAEDLAEFEGATREFKVVDDELWK